MVRVFTFYNSFFIFMKHFSVVKFLCSNFRMITANFYGVKNLGKVGLL